MGRRIEWEPKKKKTCRLINSGEANFFNRVEISLKNFNYSLSLSLSRK